MLGAGRAGDEIADRVAALLVVERALEHVDLLEFRVRMQRREGAGVDLHEPGLLAGPRIFQQRLDPESVRPRRLPRQRRAAERRRSRRRRFDATGVAAVLKYLAHDALLPRSTYNRPA